MLACRGCRVPLAAQTKGCVICEDIRRHLVDTDDDTESKPSLADVSSEVIASLRVLLKRARESLKGDPDRPETARLILSLGNTSAKVLEAARKLQVDGLAAVRNMSFVERAELFIGWFTSLPPPYRASLQAQMHKFETEVARALPEAS